MTKRKISNGISSQKKIGKILVLVCLVLNNPNFCKILSSINYFLKYVNSETNNTSTF